MPPLTFLDFEEPIVKMESQIEDLRNDFIQHGVDHAKEIKKLHKAVNRKRHDIFAKLTSWQRARLARHPARPYTLDYIKNMTTGFVELHGDRAFGDCHAIVGGFARLDGRSVMIIGTQKGRDTKDKIYRNFGMAQPEGYRKAMRLMRLAEKFGVPIVALLDTPGAYPGVGAEERGQSEAIARNLMKMASLAVPVISVVIGEGGSGGALALGVGNKVLMLENSIYSVISPEGCAAILWNSCDKVEAAADALSLTGSHLLKLGVVDEVVKEPLGGAHRAPEQAASILRRALRRHLDQMAGMEPGRIIEQRRKKFRTVGAASILQ